MRRALVASQGPARPCGAVLAPLVLAVRPPGKTPHEDLRRTMEAIIWRHRNGAIWRAVRVASSKNAPEAPGVVAAKCILVS